MTRHLMDQRLFLGQMRLGLLLSSTDATARLPETRQDIQQMTLMALSWRLLLRLVPEKAWARRLEGVVQTPAGGPLREERLSFITNCTGERIMKIGISIPPHMKEPEHLFEWVRRVDVGPFSTLSILDRVVYANYEPLITLAAAAALSTRVRLMTEILLSPLRNTTILAKESATLDALSRGRLTLGLGVGVREDDFLATEADYKRRGNHLEELLPLSPAQITR